MDTNPNNLPTKRSKKKGTKHLEKSTEQEIINPTNKCLEMDLIPTKIPEIEKEITKNINKRLRRKRARKKKHELKNAENSEKSCVNDKMEIDHEIMDLDKVSNEIILENCANTKKNSQIDDTVLNESNLNEKSELDEATNEENNANQKRKKRKRKNSKIIQNPREKKILLILDVNGLLADIIMPPPKERKSDINIYRRAIFKRPYYNDFLKFCFQNFNVGIWSSRSKRIIDKVVDYLLGDLKKHLLFCWDMFYATQTTFRTLDQKHKPLVCKELKKLWEKSDPELPWNKGDYNETNTLLIDDSPYKALLNPIGTAIFPKSYTFMDKNDNALGKGGELRVYLEKLAKCDNVKKFVEEYPFGQNAITDKDSSWSFYSEVIQSLSQPLVEEVEEIDKIFPEEEV